MADMLQKLEGFMYATSLDLNMGYYQMLRVISTEKGFDKHLEKLEKVLTHLSERPV
jgi:hypothetical protein